MSPKQQAGQASAGPWTYAMVFALAALALGCLVDQRFQLLAKLIGDTFISGYSATKGFFFIVFALLVFCSRLIRLPSPSRLRLGVTVSLATCFLLSILEHGLYCYAVGIPLTQWSWLSAAGDLSFHGLFHFHVSKAPIAWLLSYSGDWLDSGGPFLAIFSAPLVVLHLFVFVLSAVSLVLLLRQWSFERSPGYFMTTLIASVGVLKCAIDGGPFEAEVLIPLTPLIWALWGRQAALLVLPLQLLLLLFRTSALDQGRLLVEQFHIVTMILVLAAPVCVQGLWLQQRRHLSVAMGVFGFLGLLGVLRVEADALKGTRQVPRAINLYRYGQTALKPGTVFHLVTAERLPEVPVGFQVEADFRGSQFHLYEGRVTKTTTIFEICRSTGANLLRHPVSLDRDPVRLTVRGVLFNDWPTDWPQSDILLGYRCRAQGREVVLDLNLRPGSNLNVCRDALPGQVFLMTEMRVAQAERVGEGWLKPGTPHLPLPRGYLRWLPGLRRH